MPYLTPTQPALTTAGILAKAAQMSGSGQTSAALRLLTQHGLTVANMRSYLISKRGLLNGLGAAKHPQKPQQKPKLYRPMLRKPDLPPPYFAGLGRFRHYRPAGQPPLHANPVVAGLGVATSAPAPAANPDIAAQLQQINFDWPSGTLYVGTNKYSILTTLIGGLVVKSIMWGLSKGGAALKGAPPAVSGKKAH